MTKTRQYASVLAKIGAEKSNVLSEAKLKALAESKSLSEFASQFRDTSYQEQIARISAPLTSSKLERAFHENFIEVVLKLIKYSPKKSAKYLELYLLHFEVEHIKAIIKATNVQMSADQKLSRIYFIVEDYFEKHFVFEEAAKASSVSAVVQAFKGTEYWAPLSVGLKKYEETASTVSFDIALDKFYYEILYESFEALPKKERKYAKFYASMEHDRFTLLTLLRGKILNFDPNWLRLVVPQRNFDLDERTVEALVSAVDYEAALKIVLATSYAKFFFRAQDPQETVANSEKAFRKAVLQHAQASSIREIFNIGLLLSFLTQKEAEIHNLTILSLGVEASMKPEDIRNQLLL